MKDKPFYKRIPRWGWLLGVPVALALVFLVIIKVQLSTISEEELRKYSSEQEKKEVKVEKVVVKTPSRVTEDLSSILNEANQKIGFQFYKKVRIEGDDPYWAIFTISDDWYGLEPYVQERVVKIAVNYYKEVEGGLNSLAEVYLEDSFGKEVATGYYGSGGIQVEIY